MYPTASAQKNMDAHSKLIKKDVSTTESSFKHKITEYKWQLQRCYSMFHNTNTTLMKRCEWFFIAVESVTLLLMNSGYMDFAIIPDLEIYCTTVPEVIFS